MSKAWPMIGLVCLLALGACGPTLTQETFDQVQVGMTLEQVEEVLGGPGEKEVAGGFGATSAGITTYTSSEGLSEQVYVWKERARGGVEVIVKFKDGKVVTKWHRGL